MMEEIWLQEVSVKSHELLYHFSSVKSSGVGNEKINTLLYKANCHEIIISANKGPRKWEREIAKSSWGDIVRFIFWHKGSSDTK